MLFNPHLNMWWTGLFFCCFFSENCVCDAKCLSTERGPNWSQRLHRFKCHVTTMDTLWTVAAWFRDYTSMMCSISITARKSRFKLSLFFCRSVFLYAWGFIPCLFVVVFFSSSSIWLHNRIGKKAVVICSRRLEDFKWILRNRPFCVVMRKIHSFRLSCGRPMPSYVCACWSLYRSVSVSEPRGNVWYWHSYPIHLS